MALALAIPFTAAAQDFEQWRSEFRLRALSEGISSPIVDNALADVTPDETVVTLDQKQPEKKITLTKYLENTVNARRIRQGRALLEEHRAVLEKISATYGVPANYLVALWGIESDYGAFKGNFSVVASLATLAYEGRRREFFSNELIAALKIIETERREPDELTGSWAGAMGDCQFMPSTYLNFAVDGDQDGRRDIWDSPPDILASIANYLHGLGWKNDRGWGVVVETPADFAESDADINHAERLNAWRKLGLRIPHGQALGNADADLYAIYPGLVEEGAYLVTDNYKALLQWNRSRYFATAVGRLADQIGE